MIFKYENMRRKALSFITCAVSFEELNLVFGSLCIFLRFDVPTSRYPRLGSPLQYSQMLLFYGTLQSLFLLFNR